MDTSPISTDDIRVEEVVALAEAQAAPEPESEASIQARLAQLQQERILACWTEVQRVLAQHNCDLAAIIEVSPNGRTAVAQPIVIVKRN